MGLIARVARGRTGFAVRLRRPRDAGNMSVPPGVSPLQFARGEGQSVVTRMQNRRTHIRCASSAAPRGPVVAAALLLFALALQCAGLRAELLFRSAEQKDGQQVWSDFKKYNSPSDATYARTREDGTHAPAEEVQVFVQGYISWEDVYAAKVMQNLIKKGWQTIAGNTVSVAGNGGEVDAAMELGRLLRKLGVSTVVAAGEQCMSSCVFAFMGGDARSVAGRIGIHRPYFSSTRAVPDRRVHYRQLQKKLREFIEELDFPPSLYEAMMAVPPESVSVLAPAELKKFYLVGMSPSAQEEADAASARELDISVVEFLQLKAAGNSSSAAATGQQQKDQAAPAAPAAGNSVADTEASGPSGGKVGSARAAY
jgi:hypothetical protein